MYVTIATACPAWCNVDHASEVVGRRGFTVHRRVMLDESDLRVSLSRTDIAPAGGQPGAQDRPLIDVDVWGLDGTGLLPVERAERLAAVLRQAALAVRSDPRITTPPSTDGTTLDRRERFPAPRAEAT